MSRKLNHHHLHDALILKERLRGDLAKQTLNNCTLTYKREEQKKRLLPSCDRSISLSVRINTEIKTRPCLRFLIFIFTATLLHGAKYIEGINSYLIEQYLLGSTTGLQHQERTISHEIIGTAQPGLLAPEGLTWPGGFTFNVAHSQGCQTGASNWQEASILPHESFSTGLLEYPHVMLADLPQDEQSKRLIQKL